MCFVWLHHWTHFVQFCFAPLYSWYTVYCAPLYSWYTVYCAQLYSWYTVYYAWYTVYCAQLCSFMLCALHHCSVSCHHVLCTNSNLCSFQAMLFASVLIPFIAMHSINFMLCALHCVLILCYTLLIPCYMLYTVYSFIAMHFTILISYAVHFVPLNSFHAVHFAPLNFFYAVHFVPPNSFHAVHFVPPNSFHAVYFAPLNLFYAVHFANWKSLQCFCLHMRAIKIEATFVVVFTCVYRYIYKQNLSNELIDFYCWVNLLLKTFLS